MIRRIGNSLGVIIPKATLGKWGVSQGDGLELREDCIAPPSVKPGKSQLDELRFERALAVVRQFTTREIRAKSLANLHRWKAVGSWAKVYEEWQSIIQDPDDGRLFAAMLGRNENAVRLRQSAPYVGLLAPDQVRQMNEKVAA